MSGYAAFAARGRDGTGPGGRRRRGEAGRARLHLLGLVYPFAVRSLDGLWGEGEVERRLRAKQHEHSEVIDNLANFVVTDLVFACVALAAIAAPIGATVLDLHGLVRHAAVALSFGIMMTGPVAMAVVHHWRRHYLKALRRSPARRLRPEEIPALLWRGSRLAYAGGLLAGIGIAVFYRV